MFLQEPGFSFKKMTRDITRAVSIGSRARLNQTQIGPQINFKVINHCFVSNITSTINKMFMALIKLKNSRSQNNC